MKITVQSSLDFDEALYDKAFGLAKTMIANGIKSSLKHRGDYVLTARKRPDSVVVTIHAAHREV